MTDGPANSDEPLCLVVEDLDGSFAVCDGRDGGLLLRCSGLRDAAAAASLMNGRYPVGHTPPAADTLAYEMERAPTSESVRQVESSRENPPDGEFGGSGAEATDNWLSRSLWAADPSRILARLRRASREGLPAGVVGRTRRRT